MPDEEEGIQTLILTRSLHRRFIEEQKEIIRKLIRDFSPEREVFYTFFDTPKIVHEDALEDILVFKEVIYEIIFDQRGTDFVFYIRDLPEGTFTRLRGE
jgi:stalled ribosome rescue protein Dom34